MTPITTLTDLPWLLPLAIVLPVLFWFALRRAARSRRKQEHPVLIPSSAPPSTLGRRQHPGSPAAQVDAHELPIGKEGYGSIVGRPKGMLSTFGAGQRLSRRVPKGAQPKPLRARAGDENDLAAVRR